MVGSVERLRSVLGSAGEHLGDLVWWALSDAAVSRITLESIWAGAQLARELLPEPPTAEKALRLAVRTCQVGQAEHLIRLAKDEGDELVYAVVREHQPGDGTLSYTQEARVGLNRVAGSLTTDAPAHSIVRAMEEAFQTHLSVHTADDIRRMLVRTLRSFAAVTLREGGGVYWVPRSYADDVRRLEQAVAQMGTSKLSLVPVHHTAQGSRTLGEVARGSIEAELAALKQEMQAFEVDPPERPSTLERRLEMFEGVRSRAQLYRDILRVQVEDLEAQLDSMAAKVQQMLGGAA
jgi:hypothetical protein